MLRSAAETLSLEALAWAANEGALPEFLNASGLDTEDLRERAGDSELLAAFLDFILARDALIEAFCAAREIYPQELHEARRALPGAAPEG